MEKLIQFCTSASLYNGAFDNVAGWSAAGMGYVIVTENDRFIVVDGGHSDDATALIEILEKYADKLKRKGVMHCYSDGPEFIKKYIDLGFYISFAGNVTFKKYDRSFLNDIPRNRILVETDCPFLSPEPLRGTINEPKNVKYTAKFLADYYNIKYEDFEKITLDNTREVYYKLK